MILYIPLEVYTREIKAHLLLAATAVSKGYQVLIASPSDLWLYKRLNLLPKGNYLLKNINIPSHSESQYLSFLKEGFDLYCQEQEPSVIFDSFQDYINLMKIKPDQILPFKAVFCWGKRDANEYKVLFPSKSNIFYNTGSPRADLWSKQYLPLRKVNYITKLKPYILFVLNFGILMGKKHWTDHIKNLFDLELMQNDKDFENFINNFKEENKIGYDMVLAIKNISIKYPNINIVVRPHPSENPEYWKTLFYKQKNIIFSNNSDSLSSWISNSLLVIHNGCTSAVEAVIQKIPVVSYGPDRAFSKANLPNNLGVKAENLIQLENSINAIINNTNKNDQLKSENLLSDKISYDKCDSSNTMVDIISNKSKKNSPFKFYHYGLLKISFIKNSKYFVDKIRKFFGNNKLTDVDYKINKKEVINDLGVISEIHKFNSIKIKFISNTTIFLQK